MDLTEDVKPFAILEFAATQPMGKTCIGNTETIFFPIEGSMKSIALLLGYFIGNLLTKFDQILA